jgi:hypothetical protein
MVLYGTVCRKYFWLVGIGQVCTFEVMKKVCFKKTINTQHIPKTFHFQHQIVKDHTRKDFKLVC